MNKGASVINLFSVTISLSVVLVAILISLSPIGSAIDRFYLDSLFAFRGADDSPQDIIIVAIDEDSFAEINQQWPWPRSLHSKLLDSLYSAGAGAVAMDIIFSEPSTVTQDAIFSRSINKYPNTILATDINEVDVQGYTREILVKPANSLDVSDKQLGFINVPTQEDGFVRDIYFQISDYRALSYVAAYTKDEMCCKQLPGDDRILLNYTGPPGTVKTVSYYQALDPERFLSVDTFKDKLVFVGFLTTNVADPTNNKVDHFPTPFTTDASGYMSGVEIHANSAYNLLHDNYLREFSGLAYYIISILLAIIITIASLYFSPTTGLLLASIVSTALLATSIYLFNYALIFMPIAVLLLPLIFGCLVSPSIHLYRANKEKRFIKNAFGSFVSPAVVQELIENPNRLSLGGKEVNASVLFLDLAGFTTMSEKFEPPVLIEIINNCLNEITEIVLKHDGMIDKFIGDAVMAVWGAPVERNDHAYRACLAALEIQLRLKEVAAIEKRKTGAELAARIGVNSGSMVAGNVGGHRRFEYTVHGNDVNVASRLEGVNKFYSTEIIIGENTVRLLNDQFDLRKLDRVRLKGKKEPVELFELQSLTGSINEQQALCNKHYQDGYELYVEGIWKGAINSFDMGLAYMEDDGPCLNMIERCKSFLENPPAENWIGVYDMTSK